MARSWALKSWSPVPHLASADHLAAQALELALEIGRQAHGVVLADVDEDGRPPLAQVLIGVARRHLALEGVDEADAEDVVLALADDGVGGRGRDQGHTRLLGDGGGGQGRGAGDRPQHGHDLLLAHQAAGGVGRLHVVALVVRQDQLDGPAQRPPGAWPGRCCMPSQTIWPKAETAPVMERLAPTRMGCAAPACAPAARPSSHRARGNSVVIAGQAGAWIRLRGVGAARNRRQRPACRWVIFHPQVISSGPWLSRLLCRLALGGGCLGACRSNT